MVSISNIFQSRTVEEHVKMVFIHAMCCASAVAFNVEWWSEKCRSKRRKRKVQLRSREECLHQPKFHLAPLNVNQQSVKSWEKQSWIALYQQEKWFWRIQHRTGKQFGDSIQVRWWIIKLCRGEVSKFMLKYSSPKQKQKYIFYTCSSLVVKEK